MSYSDCLLLSFSNQSSPGLKFGPILIILFRLFAIQTTKLRLQRSNEIPAKIFGMTTVKFPTISRFPIRGIPMEPDELDISSHCKLPQW